MPLVHPNEKLHGVIANKKVAVLNKEIFNNKDEWNDGPGPCVDVLSTEEKGSDVNLAVHLVNDAWNNAFECAVILSNDSDLAEAMFLVKNRGKKLGLITSTNRPTKRLVKLSSFHRRIKNSTLKKSQLPDQIPNTTLHRPEEW